jgi:superfamily I DNA/RNA helicase
MAATWRDGALTPREVRDAVRTMPEVREALERMWPLLTPAQLLHDLFGSKALLRLAAAKHLSETEYMSLYRPRRDDVSEVRWTEHDVALLDEARNFLGAKPTKGNPAQNGHNAPQPDGDDIRTYGHIVVDEVQDLTPMQLRMISRRSLNGSMTVVGDIAQATGALAPNDWVDVLRHLPEHKPSRVIGLSVGYRIPAQIMALANQVMAAATPTLRAPTSVRQSDTLPEFVHPEADDLLAEVARATNTLMADITDGTIAVVAPDSMVEQISAALDAAGIDHARATRTGLEMGVTVVPVSVVKGLELDGVVVVEPAKIVAEEQQGLRALYVALTRSTRRLTIVHSEPLPAAMQQTGTPSQVQ